MHALIVAELVRRARQRISDGDCPSVQAFSVGQMEEAIAALAQLVSALIDAGENYHASPSYLHEAELLRVIAYGKAALLEESK